MILSDHKTKIVCTIGPSSSSEEMIRGLILRGMNIARLNFSHGELSDHREIIYRIRNISGEIDKIIPILVDLPGPKIRIGKLSKEPLLLQQGETVILTSSTEISDDSLIPVDYSKLTQSISPGSLVYINDGFLQLECLEVSGTNVKCKVIVGGELTSHKGVNLPGSSVFLEPVTEKDLKLVDFALEEGLDCFSISFIESADDVRKIREYADSKGKKVFLVAKIERERAVQNIDSILLEADAIMIARGDLGVEIPIEDVPIVQKKIIHKANLRSIPVITATQMLESMTSNIRPTRAEATDVANAIIDGTDAVMLSAETAVGKYPLATVEIMAKIARQTEKWRSTSKTGIYQMKKAMTKMQLQIDDIISLQINEALQQLPIKQVLVPTVSGETCRHISRFRPDAWIIGFSRYLHTCNRLAFQYGVIPIFVEGQVTDWEYTAFAKLRQYAIYAPGELVIITQGQTAGHGKQGGTNLLKFIRLE
ncbi:pyruvate kinase [Methanomethylovorans sp.]|uniref:pyruvate kinase n=2 Tax=Methanomethylovorans sp. TaxID=2758717 RepID=UPI00351C2352